MVVTAMTHNIVFLSQWTCGWINWMADKIYHLSVSQVLTMATWLSWTPKVNTRLPTSMDHSVRHLLITSLATSSWHHYGSVTWGGLSGLRPSHTVVKTDCQPPTVEIFGDHKRPPASIGKKNVAVTLFFDQRLVLDWSYNPWATISRQKVP